MNKGNVEYIRELIHLISHYGFFKEYLLMVNKYEAIICLLYYPLKYFLFIFLTHY